MGLIAVWVLVLLFQNGASRACQWTSGKEIGKPTRTIDEDSGLAISRRFPNRLYHVNDSGDTGRFFITDFSGRNLQIVNVRGFNPFDAEDLAIGPCSATTLCLFIGDIGNNIGFRRNLQLAVIEERETFESQVDAKYLVQMQYPDGAHDAESLAVHPDGTVYIMTKEHTAQLYRLRRDRWMNANGSVQMLEPVGPFNLEALGAASRGRFDRLPTAMDISPDGKRILVLTYRNVFEFFFDLSQPLPPPATWQAGHDYRRMEVETLPQQEGIAYTPDGRSFIYDTEMPRIGKARIMRSDCR